MENKGLDWECSSMVAYYVQGPDFKPHSTKKRRKEKETEKEKKKRKGKEGG
jgi:hypothetical protein